MPTWCEGECECECEGKIRPGAGRETRVTAGQDRLRKNSLSGAGFKGNIPQGLKAAALLSFIGTNQFVP